jgi:hypothetical protein
MGAAIWLWQEHAAIRQIVVADHDPTRGRHDLDRRPAVPNEPGQLQPVHRSRHLDIGEDDVDIWTLFQDGDGLVGIGRLDDLEARAFEAAAQTNAGSVTTYLATADSGQIAITPQGGAGTTNDLDFTGGITDQNLWFLQSGNDLKIDILGTDTSVTSTGWFSGSTNQLQEITAGSLKIDSQVSQLVQAMATYAANNSGFDPTSPSYSATLNDTSLDPGEAWRTKGG